MKKFPRLIIFLVATAVVSASLSGCGKKKNPVSPASSSSSSSTSSDYSSWNKAIEARSALDAQNYAYVESLARKRIYERPEDASAHFLLGQALMGQKNYKAAEKSLETASSLVPDNLNYTREYSRSLAILAEEAESKRDYTQAISLYKKLLEKGYEPNKTEKALSDVYIVFARRLLTAKEYSEAEILLTEATNLLNDTTEIRLELAKLYIDDDRLMEAERLLKKLSDTNPNNSDCAAVYASLLQKMGDIDEAREMANRALRLDSTNSLAMAIKTSLDGDLPAIIVSPIDSVNLSLEAINERIKFFERTGNLREKKNLLEICLQRFPDQIGAYYKMADVCEKLGEIDKALESIERYVSTNTSSPEGQFLYAKCLNQKGRSDEALTILSNLENSYNDKFAVLNEKGQALARKGDFDTAIETWKAVLSQSPNNPDALFYLGQLSSESGKFEEAASYYDSAIRQQPFNNKFKYFAGLNYVQSGNKEKAAQLWDASKATLNPNDPYAARIFRALGENPELRSVVSTSISNIGSENTYGRIITIGDSEEDPIILDTEISEMPSADYDKALEYARNGNFQESEIMFRQVIAREPNNFNAMMNLGKIYTATYKHNIGAAIFLKALKIDSRNIHALRALANSYSEVGMHSLASQITDQVKLNYPDQLKNFPTYTAKNIKNDPRAIEPMATALIQENLNEEALAVVQSAISEQGGNNNLYLLQGDIYKQMRMFDLAMESYRYVQNADQQNPASYIKIGDLYLSAGQPLKALPEYRKALATPFITPDNMFYVADRYEQMGRISDAKSVLGRLRTMNLNMAHVKELDRRLGTNVAEETEAAIIASASANLNKQ